MAKYITETKPNESVRALNKKHLPYLTKRNHPIAKYALWLYLQSKGYKESQIKEIISFKKKSITAINDQEKLAQYVLTKKELLFLVENIKKPRDRLIIKLLYDTGARVSELLNIKLKDIDLETNEVFLIGKGRKPRSVYFQHSTSELLQKYLTFKELVNPSSKLFTIKPVTVWHHLKKYGREILERDLRPHMLRHTRLQHMADEGVDSFLIKSYAGHSDISTTQIYVKNSKFQRKLAFSKAGDIWNR